MKKATRKGIAATRRYSVREVMALLNCSRSFISLLMNQTTNPLRFVIDKNTGMIRFDGGDLIRRLNEFKKE